MLTLFLFDASVAITPVARGRCSVCTQCLQHIPRCGDSRLWAKPRSGLRKSDVPAMRPASPAPSGWTEAIYPRLLLTLT